MFKNTLHVALVRGDRRKEGKFGGDSRVILGLGGVNVMLRHYTNPLDDGLLKLGMRCDEEEEGDAAAGRRPRWSFSLARRSGIWPSGWVIIIIRLEYLSGDIDAC